MGGFINIMTKLSIILLGWSWVVGWWLIMIGQQYCNMIKLLLHFISYARNTWVSEPEEEADSILWYRLKTPHSSRVSRTLSLYGDEGAPSILPSLSPTWIQNRSLAWTTRFAAAAAFGGLQIYPNWMKIFLFFVFVSIRLANDLL